MTRPESVVFLLVAYGNLAEVERFVAETRRAEPSSAVSFAVCDNSPTSVPTSLEDRDDVVLVRRPDNPGYLPGGLAALKTWVSATGGLPDWAVLSNTDLTTESSGLLDVLAEHDPTRPLVLAPRITEGEARIEKNPHLRLARSPRRHRLNHVVTRRSVVFFISDFQAEDFSRALTITSRRHDFVAIRIDDEREEALPDIGLRPR